MDGVYYKHSGKYSTGDLLTGSALSAVVALFTAALYAYLILYIPIAGYISFLFTAAFGGVVGYAMAKLLKSRLVRNSRSALLATFAITTVAFYFHWAVWVNAALQRAELESSLAVTLVPTVLWQLITTINAEGAWTIRNWTPSGGALWTIWALEAAILYAVALAVAYGEMESEPFCENCQVWCPRKEAVVNVAPAPDGEELKRRMEARDIKFLEQLGPMPESALAWEQIDLHSCPKCNSTNTLSVQHVTVKIEKKETKQDTSETISKIVLTVSDADQVRRLGEKFKTALPAAAASAGTSS